MDQVLNRQWSKHREEGVWIVTHTHTSLIQQLYWEFQNVQIHTENFKGNVRIIYRVIDPLFEGMAYWDWIKQKDTHKYVKSQDDMSLDSKETMNFVYINIIDYECIMNDIQSRLVKCIDQEYCQGTPFLIVEVKCPLL